MTMKSIFITSLFLLSLILLPSSSCTQKKIYVVNFGDHRGDKTPTEIEDFHKSYLLSVKETEEEAKTSLLYSYKHSINGFAALLTPEEASKLSEMKEVVSVYHSKRRYYLHTTRSWEFVGLGKSLTQESRAKEDILSPANYGEDIIVGMIDTGLWPESKSFSDEGMKPVPKRWKGICQAGTQFNSSHCNKKIIGARYYLRGYENDFGPLDQTQDYKSPRDKDGHGSHTSSIVAGRAVPGASALGGFANGTAWGGAPLARLAIYKACWPVKGQPKNQGNICFEIDMLAAIDDAIYDGVDVLSISIGAQKPVPYKEDAVARGALRATMKNIVVVCSAGNSGPSPQSLSNPAPWIITVGASSLDRSFQRLLMLGNGLTIEGLSIAPSLMENKLHPLVYAGDVELPWVKGEDKGQCLNGSLNPDKVKGKIVFCIRGKGLELAKGLEVKRAGAVGFILGNSENFGDHIQYDPHFLPATGIAYVDSLRLLNYIKHSQNPTAYILPGRTLLNSQLAPVMASFSSRGPNVVDPNILKPDITAPGVNILAAWTEADGPTRMPIDNRVAKYNIFSGTSMSCPHVSAAAALLKAIHPTWSSAAIRSALMTTAGITNNLATPLTDETGNVATPFAYGAGHLRPIQAANPGLVYDASYEDYLLYTCSLGVTEDLHASYDCPESPPEPVNLNYPSIQIHRLNGSKTVKRTVTNVATSKSPYVFLAQPPKGFRIKASPDILWFDHVGQKMSFNITVTLLRGEAPTKYAPDEYYFGWYSWINDYHWVRSPVAVSLA